MFTLVVWKITVPSRIHIFLWLLAKSKTRRVGDKTSVFCSKLLVSVRHLCRQNSETSNICTVELGNDFQIRLMANFWISNNKTHKLSEHDDCSSTLDIT